ncbi:biotin transporter BioY [Paracoccus fontiphilus]|uniref:Biotin transporter n=1 Tax=Paracoccus fontiphilus TaxID=1815556 RepID=A0ABV7IC12_9RHOB|nr:biotin transporter BioY [Paracoccus fontiphilus]
MERNMTQIALFAALIAALGLIPSLTLAFGVPITAQSMGVMLAGAILGARRGALAVLLVLALVALGLPLLAGGRGGLGVFVSPTAGFLAGWLAAAFVIGLIVKRLRAGPLAVTVTLASVVGGIGVMYAFGILGMSIVLDKTLAECAVLVMAFVPGDIIKAVLTGLITQALARSRPASILSRH